MQHLKENTAREELYGQERGNKGKQPISCLLPQINAQMETLANVAIIYGHTCS